MKNNDDIDDESDIVIIYMERDGTLANRKNKICGKFIVDEITSRNLHVWATFLMFCVTLIYFIIFGR